MKPMTAISQHRTFLHHVGFAFLGTFIILISSALLSFLIMEWMGFFKFLSLID